MEEKKPKAKEKGRLEKESFGFEEKEKLDAANESRK